MHTAQPSRTKGAGPRTHRDRRLPYPTAACARTSSRPLARNAVGGVLERPRLLRHVRIRLVDHPRTGVAQERRDDGIAFAGGQCAGCETVPVIVTAHAPAELFA